LVKSSREALAAAETILRGHRDDMTPGDPFETLPGQFWTFRVTRPYMQARHDLATSQLNLRTGEATEAALGHFLDMLRLSRGDNMGVRHQIPGLYLRLGRDQEAYDFMMWYSGAERSKYNWHDVDQPFLDLKGADALEPFDSSGILVDLSFLAAMTLLKIRLMLDLVDMDKAVKSLGDKAPQDRMELVKEHARGDILLWRKDIVDRADYKDPISDLRKQVRDMYAMVDDANEYFWPALVNPAPYANAMPTGYSRGSREEIFLKFRYSWYSWAETPGALELIRSGELKASK
jgi:hypothetical protein